ncbi:MAG: hypothetical protein HC827_13185 [Cyanobacteria bacterium RM1_2_2]|nr:hypothetical protein [Cyanobacteria bacterium RM1_2_2]
MELSTFELLVKRIAPVTDPVADPVGAAVARRVVQGYFLTLSNLETANLAYQLEFFISRPNPADPNRSLFDQADAIYDIAGANLNLKLYGDSSTTRFRTSFTIPAGQTASFQLLPKPALFFAPVPQLEVRGYVVLSLPPIFDLNSFSFKAQTNRPARVLLNPEMRGTFFPNDFPAPPPAGLDGDFDQINYPLAIASGKGLNTLDPEPTFFPGLISTNPAAIATLKAELIAKLAVAPNELSKIQALIEFGDLVKANPLASPSEFSSLIASLVVPT